MAKIIISAHTTKLLGGTSVTEFNDLEKFPFLKLNTGKEYNKREKRHKKQKITFSGTKKCLYPPLYPVVP
ncbi:MAG: hypothetical protein MJZ60_08670, partial [Bacteroidaceae bacterium]|nr:hypothetical protein [Bacteroidaceae bacterium]